MDNGKPSSVKDFLMTSSQLKMVECFLPTKLSMYVPTKGSSRTIPGSKQPSESTTTTPTAPGANPPSKPPANTLLPKPRSREFLAIINKLKRFEKIDPFLYPVDPVLLNIPDYSLVIKHPMDLSTIETKARNGEYESFEQFEADVRLIVFNATLYNPPGNPVHTMAQELGAYFDQVLKSGSQVSEPEKLAKPKSDQKSKPTENKKAKKPADETPLSYNEKIALVEMIKNKLPRESLWEVWRIVSPGKPETDNIDFDLDKLANNVARELQNFVISQVKQRSKKKKDDTQKEDHKEPVSTQTQQIKKTTPEPPAARKNSESSYWSSSSDES